MSQTISLVVFDARRGNEEGQGREKVLGFYPTSTPMDTQISLAGLLQGLLAFSSGVLPQGARPPEIIENEASIWAVAEAEPAIHLALLAKKAGLPRHVTNDSLLNSLRHIHNLMCLIFCSIQSMLDKDESAQLARSCIERVLNHAGHDLNDLTSWLNRELRSPLTTLGHAPTVSASLGTRLEVHSLCHRIQLAELGGDRLVQDVIVTWKELVLWSTLQPADTARLSSLLGSSILKPASATPSFWASTSSAQSNLQRLDNGFLVLRPADLGANSPEPEAPGVHSLPFVYSTSSRLKYLLVHHTGHLGIISLMMRGQEELSDAALTALLRVMKPPAAALAARLTEEAQAQGGELGHVAGWRYAVREDDHIIRASPRSKVSAMTHHARAVGSALVDSLSRTYPGAAVGNVSLSIANGEKSSVENGETAASNGSEDTVDVSVKSSYGTWAKAQGGRAAGKLSVAIREKKMEDGIAKDLDAIDAGLRSLELV